MEAKVEAKSLKRQSIENLTLCFQCAPYLSRLYIPVVLWNRAPYITPITCKRTFGVIDNPVLEKNSIQTFSSSDAVLFSAAFTCLTGLPPCIITFEFSLRSPVALMDHRGPVGQSEGAHN